MRPAALAFVAWIAAAPALGATPSVLPFYLEGSNAPAPLVSRVDERLRAAFAERGIPVASEPAPAAPSDARVAAARKDLEKGLAAYRALQLETAIPSLREAEAGALAAPDSADAPKILADARIYLGLIAQATGKEAEADRLFRAVAVTDPERRLDSKQFPPDTVAVYEKSRKAVAAGPFADVALSATLEGASFFADGRPLSAATARLSFGEHLLLATADGASAGETVLVGEPKIAWRATIVPDITKLDATLRAAAKRGDEAAILRAADAVAAAAGAGRILFWDLRSVGGHIEAPLRLRDTGSRGASRPSVADLGAGVAFDSSMRAAVALLFSPESAPIVATRESRHRPTASTRKGAGGWIWWAAGGLAIVAAGGAAAALAQPASSGDKVAVTVER